MKWSRVVQRTIFRGQSQFDQLLQIFKTLGTPQIDQWQHLARCNHWHVYPTFIGDELEARLPKTPALAADLLKHMLQCNPACRPSAEQCLRHPYFASVFNEADLYMSPFDASDVMLRTMPSPDPALQPSSNQVFINCHPRT